MSVPALFSTLASALCLGLSIYLFFASVGNQGMTANLQKQQQELQEQQGSLQLQQQQFQTQQQTINSATALAQEQGPAVLRDVATLAVQNKNDKLRDLLGKYGLSIQENTPAPGASPAAAAPAPAPAAPAPARATPVPR